MIDFKKMALQEPEFDRYITEFGHAFFLEMPDMVLVLALLYSHFQMGYAVADVLQVIKMMSAVQKDQP